MGIITTTFSGTLILLNLIIIYACLTNTKKEADSGEHNASFFIIFVMLLNILSVFGGIALW